MKPLLSEIAAQLRAAIDPAERSRLTTHLATAVRERIVEVIRQHARGQVAADDIEDGAQELVHKMVARIVSGDVDPGGELHYVSKAARYKAYDILKGKSTFKHRRFRAFAPDAEPVADPFATPEGEAQLADMTALLREGLESLRESYREVITAHDLHGIPLKTIAAQWVEQGRAETQAKAEQNVQAAHSRGIKALRRWVLERIDTEARAEREEDGA